jgi:hypothetical protein
MKLALAILTFASSLLLPVLADTEQSPADAYREIHKQEINATCFEDFLKFRSARSMDKDKPTTPEEKKMFLEMIKLMAPKKFEIVSVDTVGDEATIHVNVPSEDPKEKTTGTVTLVKEKGVWKLDQEKWKTKIGDVP